MRCYSICLDPADYYDDYSYEDEEEENEEEEEDHSIPDVVTICQGIAFDSMI